MKTKKIHLRSSSRAVALEPRLLFDGAGAVAAVDAIDDHDYSQQQEGQVQDVHTTSVTQNSAADTGTLEIIDGGEGLHIPSSLGSRLGLDGEHENILAGTEEKTLLVIDSRVDNHELLLEGLHGNVDVMIVEAGQSGLDAISQQLASKGGYDAIHIISHGTPGSFALGSDLVDSAKLQQNSQQLQSWADYLSEGADILLYGCDVAQGTEGQSFIEELAAITGADIAASTNPTGAADKGGDWVLESATGAIEAGVFAAMGYDGLLADPAPTVTISLPAGNEVFIGGSFDFTLEFKNMGGDGYGPYVDLFLPKGADGDDGIDIAASGAIKYLTKDVNYQIITLNGSGQADHPYAKDTTGAAVKINGIAGQKVVVIELPFGSFTSGQPAAALTVSATVNNKADLGTGLALQASAGFRYGATAVEDYATDPSILGVTVDSTITPTLVKYEYIFDGPEGETVTGPNFPRTMTTNIKVAPGQTLNTYEISIDLPDNVVVTHIDGVELDTPLFGTAAANEVVRNVGNITGSSGPNVVAKAFTLTYYIPDVKGGGGDVLDSTTGAASNSQFQVSGTGNWTPIDTRDASGAQTYDPAGVEYQHSIKSLAVQKTVVNTTDTDNSPGDALKYTLDFQVSDYFQFKDLVIVDKIDDGNTTSGTPELKITYEGVEYTLSLTGHFSESTNSTTHDVTRTYDISAALKDSSINGSLPDDLKTGILTGGKFNGKDSTGTFGSIIYTAVIGDRFISPEVGDAVINHGDHITSSASISGTVVKADGNDGSSVPDSTATDLEIVSGKLDLSVVYVNGSAVPADGIRPGDTVTYELTYDLANGDFEKLLLDAYLPMPVFNVSGGWTKDSPGTGTPEVGHWMLVSGGTNVSDINNQVTMSTDVSANGLKFDLGSRDDPSNTFGQVKIRFTVKVADDPFADGLFLTAQAQASDSNTPGDAAIKQDIDQIKLNEPKLEIIHGIVAKTGDGTIAGTTGSWAVPGSPGQPFTGTLNAVTGIDGNITNIDAGDKVVFAAGIINVGGHDAHNIVTGAFTVPEGFKLIKKDGTDAANLSEANLKVYLGDGTLLAVGTDYTVDANGVITLNKTGVDLARGHGTGFVAGKNILVITYDAVALTAIPAGKVSTSTFAVESYRSVDAGGGDFLPGAVQISDTATATVKEPAVKVVFKDGSVDASDSSSASTTGADMVIGESMLYDIVVTLPEGTTHDLNVNALVPPGMMLDTSYNGTGYEIITTKGTGVGQSDALAANFAGTVNSSPTVTGNSGAVDADPKFAFGNVTVTDDNTANNNSFVIRVKLIAANENTGGNNNQAGTTRTPTASLTYDKGGDDTDTSVTASGDNSTITIREPSLKIVKEADTDGNGTFTGTEPKIDAGDTVTYKITISHNTGSRDAYDLTFGDTFDSVLDMKTAVGEWTVMQGTTDISDQFEWVGNKLQTKADANVDLATTESIVITVQGTANASVAAKATFDSEATVTWSSLNSTDASAGNKDPNERDGSGGVGTDAAVLNNYAAKDGAPVGVNATYTLSRVGGLADTVMSGNTATDDQNVAVGEVVRFRLVMQMPEGDIPDLSMLPVLPAGYELLADGATWALLGENGDTFDGNSHYLAGGNPGNIDAGLNSGNTPVASALGGTANLNSGKFELGTVKNTDNDNTKAEYIVLEFNAIVKNVTGNTAGANLQSKVEVYTGVTKLGESNTTKDIVVEPQISAITKDVIDIAPGVQTGDPHQITVKNSFITGATNASPAYDVKLVDQFPGGSDYALSSVKIGGTIYPAGSLPAGVTATVTASGVELNFDKLEPGTAVEVIYTAKVTTDTVQPADSSADATLTWSSLPGDAAQPNLTFAGATGTNDGTETGERTGSGVDANTYKVTDPAGYGTISGTVWDDTKNRDGVVDAGEELLAGVTVTLKWSNADGVERTLTTTTDASGNYSFGALPLGNYTIETPATLNATIDGDPDTLKPRYDADGSGNGLNKIAVTLTEGGTHANQNFGYLQENDAPTVTFSDTTVREFTEGVNIAGGDQNVLGTPVNLGIVTIADTELARNLDDYNGTTLTIGRSDGSTGFALNGDDVLGFYTTGTVSISGNTISVGGTAVATFTNTGGQMVITFNGSADATTVNTVASAITYANSSQNPSTSHGDSYNVPLRFQFNDGNDNDKQGWGCALTGDAIVTVKVIAQNDPPVANNDSNTVIENTVNPAHGNVIKGTDRTDTVRPAEVDSDPDTPIDDLIVKVDEVTGHDGTNPTSAVPNGDGSYTVQGQYGELTIHPDGSYEYALNEENADVNDLTDGNSLTDTFKYKLNDGQLDSNEADLVITIQGKTDGAPSITPEDHNGGTAGQNTVYERGLRPGSDGSHQTTGKIKVQADSAIDYIEIEGVQISIAAMQNAANNPISIPTDKGTLVIDGYTPLAQYNGKVYHAEIDYTYTLAGREDNSAPADNAGVKDEISLLVQGQEASSAPTTGQLDIWIVDDTPTAVGDEAEVVKQIGAVSGNVYTNDTIGADGPKTGGAVTPVTDAATSNNYGTITIDANGDYTYTLNQANPAVQNLTGTAELTDTYTYTITDADGDTSTATLTITIKANQPPVANDDIRSTPEDTPVAGNVIKDGGAGDQPDSDPDNDPLIVTQVVIDGVTTAVPAVGTPVTIVIDGKGTLVIDKDGSYSFTPVPDWNGTVPPIEYTISDGNGGTATAELKITVTPVRDVADDRATTPAGNPVNIPVLSNDSFSNPDAKLDKVTQPANGSVVINPDGTVTYKPNPGFSGTDTFTYTVISGGVTETATVTVVVEPEHVPAPPPAPPVDTGSNSPLYDPTGGATRSPLTGSAVITDPSVFHDVERWDDLRRLPIPLHPVVYVNNEVNNSQLQREFDDFRAGSDMGMATPYEFGSVSLGMGLGQDRNLFVSHAIRQTQGYASVLEDRVSSRLGRTGLSADDLLATPELRQPDPEQMVTAELFEQQQPAWISLPQVAEADAAEAGADVDGPLLAEAPLAGAAPSFSEQLRGGGQRLPMAARDKTFLIN